mmetsp:Transcript_9801/g.18611  ORF Transcript_9801/g.18611 Transcript_9801/m.18611 type:complete len:93 (+) Transcript_9801:150-428(+)
MTMACAHQMPVEWTTSLPGLQRTFVARAKAKSGLDLEAMRVSRVLERVATGIIWFASQAYVGWITSVQERRLEMGNHVEKTRMKCARRIHVV